MLITHVFSIVLSAEKTTVKFLTKMPTMGMHNAKQWFFLSSPDLFIYEEEF
jgi:hypothetical protein